MKFDDDKHTCHGRILLKLHKSKLGILVYLFVACIIHIDVQHTCPPSLVIRRSFEVVWSIFHDDRHASHNYMNAIIVAYI